MKKQWKLSSNKVWKICKHSCRQQSTLKFLLYVFFVWFICCCCSCLPFLQWMDSRILISIYTDPHRLAWFFWWEKYVSQSSLTHIMESWYWYSNCNNRSQIDIVHDLHIYHKIIYTQEYIYAQLKNAHMQNIQFTDDCAKRAYYYDHKWNSLQQYKNSHQKK